MFIAHHTEENIVTKNKKQLMVFCIIEQVYEGRQMHIVYLEIRPSFLCPLCYSCCELKALFFLIHEISPLRTALLNFIHAQFSSLFAVIFYKNNI